MLSIIGQSPFKLESHSQHRGWLQSPDPHENRLDRMFSKIGNCLAVADFSRAEFSQEIRWSVCNLCAWQLWPSFMVVSPWRRLIECIDMARYSMFLIQAYMCPLKTSWGIPSGILEVSVGVVLESTATHPYFGECWSILSCQYVYEHARTPTYQQYKNGIWIIWNSLIECTLSQKSSTLVYCTNK